MAEEQIMLKSSDYKKLGLIGNPFRPPTSREGEHLGMAVELNSAANQLLAAIESEMASDRPRSLWVEKSDRVASMYHRGAESRAEKVLISDEGMGILPCYVQLFMMHVGRVRATANVLAERIATRQFDQTLAAWIATFIDSPDETLKEWEEVKGEPWDAFVGAFKEDQLAALEDVFGPCEIERRLIDDPVADIREVSLEEEPEESEDSAEEDTMTAQIPAASVPEATGDIERVFKPYDPVAGYIKAHAREHLSPVLARGIGAYRERGFGQLAQELKITKAPRRTYQAMIKFARSRFRHIVYMYDGWDNWPAVPADLKTKIITSLTELKLLLGEDGTFIFLVGRDHAPDLEDQFAGGSTRVVWEFAGMKWIGDNPNMVNADVAQRWVDLASIGEPSMSVTDGPLSKVLETANGDLASFCEIAADAVDTAARRGASTVEAEDVDEALSRA